MATGSLVLRASLVLTVLSAPALAQTPSPTQVLPARPFFIDVAHDYRNFLSWDSAQWLAIGGVISLAISGADDALREATEDPDAPVTRALEGGDTYGNLSLQVPLAVGWWAIAHASGSARGAAAGRDLLRAQISAVSWTYALKFAVNRERPNGDPRSFPSGHASATFAAATVLHQHYGWKIGVPAFAAATYTAASRITVNKHWASDVAFGAVVGMVAGRTVTVHLRQKTLRISPLPTPGGIAIAVTPISQGDQGDRGGRQK
jgi:membrane-associated phospholipid phosphatase